MLSIQYYDTPIGKLGFAANESAITHVLFEGEKVDAVQAETAIIRAAYAELMEYLAGERRRFTVPLAPAGTDFQRRSWQALIEIPYGETRTYAQIAQSIGSPQGYRAVGMANNRNPIPLFIPCHRVISTNGQLTGFRGGLAMKEHLLKLEAAHREGK